jgi:ABC-type xylose transport system substrate-binding protein
VLARPLAAKRPCVPVVSYDRLIRNSDVDLYVSFDNIAGGRRRCRYAGSARQLKVTPMSNNDRFLMHVR